MSTRSPRGPYAKSAAKRKLILEAALAAYAEAGSRGVSVRDIAERVGLTDAGVLHHFGSREALLTAVLEARDIAAAETYGEEAAFWRPEMLAKNAETPGLVKLFVDLAAAAAEPEHPAHDFFAERYRVLRQRIAGAVAAGRPSGEPASPAGQACDADWAARVLLAATDGLQLQWLLDPSIDMASDIARLRDVLLDALDRAGGGKEADLSPGPASERQH
ncbi:TetR/AcrR family transcriptional regulator [Kitasatospora atroaurantiaca]|uniref:TetR family transcriptional regulator n=1 Tax=Kitasatospora atroaurantiaca TaxID=285545 RepID=A0A561EJV9_9ACTN|nr:TetR/AcrR family transcriptional regulator [Kitasatospora atroaurantiaca]TWE15862.1 TetR family transcriptional regulator [Kitasatospora atroaurantiaca]